MRYSRLFFLGFLPFLFLIGCNCKPPMKLSVYRDSDRDMSCSQIKDEILQAEFIERDAKNKRGIGWDQALAPFCWYGSFSNYTEAQEAARNRQERLQKMYDSKKCMENSEAEKDQKASSSNEPPQLLRQPVSNSPLQNQAPASSGALQSRDPNLHIHIMPNGTQIMHSHPNSGPHIHLPDGTIRGL